MVYFRHKIEKGLSFANEPQLLYVAHWSGLESQASNAESFACSYNRVLQLLTTQILVATSGIAGYDTGCIFDVTANVTSPCMAS